MRVIHRLPVLALVLSFAGFGAGCGAPYEVHTPAGFVAMSEGDRHYDEDAYEYRASSADGVVLGVRSWDNEPKVDLPLAVRALENRTRFGQGYALIEKREVTTASGAKGMELRFGHDEGGTANLYRVTIFVSDDHITIVEAGGDKDLVEKAEASIAWFVKNLVPG